MMFTVSLGIKASGSPNAKTLKKSTIFTITHYYYLDIKFKRKLINFIENRTYVLELYSMTTTICTELKHYYVKEVLIRSPLSMSREWLFRNTKRAPRATGNWCEVI